MKKLSTPRLSMLAASAALCAALAAPAAAQDWPAAKPVKVVVNLGLAVLAGRALSSALMVRGALVTVMTPAGPWVMT